MDDRTLEAISESAQPPQETPGLPESIAPDNLADLETLTKAPATRDRAATVQWLRQRPGAIGRWVTARPWLALPILGVFPAIAWQLDRTRPPEPPKPAAIATPQATPLGALMQPTTSGQPLPQPTIGPDGKPLPTTSPSPTPIDLNKLTPEQKAQNARAKAALLGAAALVDSQIEMLVAIVTKAPAIAVGGASLVEVSDASGKVLFNLAANEIYTAQPNSGGITIGDQTLPGEIYLNAPQTGVVIVSGRPYRGRMRMVLQPDGLWVVNQVNMRNYLQSVVASEVSPNWGKEALKAQAVAARSYALTYYFKPVKKDFYHLGNDEYYQVYSGIEREAAETNAAVDETSGEYVSHKGGIVESLYAASDDIVMEAFQGKGMSQLGAKALASQGYKYEQILSGYYPTTSVGKIVQEF